MILLHFLQHFCCLGDGDILHLWTFSMWHCVLGQEHCPTLWVGTNAGTIYIHQLTVPSEDKRSTDEVQCVLCMFDLLTVFLI